MKMITNKNDDGDADKLDYDDDDDKDNDSDNDIGDNDVYFFLLQKLYCKHYKVLQRISKQDSKYINKYITLLASATKITKRKSILLKGGVRLKAFFFVDFPPFS